MIPPGNGLVPETAAAGAPATRRTNSTSPGGAPPAMLVTRVPSRSLSAEIICPPPSAMPMWVCHTHRSPGCAPSARCDTVLARPHARYSVVFGPWPRPSYPADRAAGSTIPRSCPSTQLQNDEQSHGREPSGPGAPP